MALNTYAELKTAIADWLERADLTARIPDFIALAEVRLNRILRTRMGEVNGALTTTPGSRRVALPGDFAEAIAVWRAGEGCRTELGFVDPALMEVRSDAGPPDYWTLEAGDLALERPADRAYGLTLRYRKRFGLSEAEPTNWLLTDAPDLYLFGALLEAAPYLRDSDLLALFQVRYDTAVREANNLAHASRSQSRLRAEPPLGPYDIRSR